MKATAALANILPQANEIDVRRLTFTMVSNYLLDVLIPAISRDKDCPSGPVAVLILVMMERKTIGFHRNTAGVSIPDMMKFTGRSRSTVRRARRYLIDKGYLEVVEEGNGLKKTVYRLNFVPDNTASVVEVSELVESVEKPIDEIIDLPAGDSKAPKAPQKELPAPAVSGIADDQAPDPPLVPESNNAHLINKPSKDQGDAVSSRPSSVIQQVITRPPDSDHPPLTDDGEADPLPPEPSDPAPPVSQTKKPLTPLKSRVFTHDPPPDYSSVYTPTCEYKKTNTESAEERKKAVAAVCSFFRQWGFEPKPENYAFVAWCIKTYGVAAVDHKLAILKCQLLRGVKFANIWGWLRSALAREYKYSKRDAKKITSAKAQERRREQERRKAEAWTRHCDTIKAEESDPEVQARIQKTIAEGNARLGITT